MKKSLLYFIGILVGIFILLSLLDYKSDYVAEETIWRANRKLSDVLRNPEAAPEKVYEQIAGQYQKVIEGLPQSKLAPVAQILLGKVYIAKKNYETARKKLQEVFIKYPQNAEACAEAASTIGSTYEEQGNWSQALKTYEKLKQDYPLTDLGLSVPLYIANYYTVNNHSANAQNAFVEATSYYNKMASEHPNSAVEFKSLRLLSNCYLAQKKWAEAIDVMGKMLLKYPVPEIAMPIVKSINTIALTQLKDYDIPIKIYQEFLDKNPKHPLDKILKDMINAFKKLKTKNVTMTPKESP